MKCTSKKPQLLSYYIADRCIAEDTSNLYLSHEGLEPLISLINKVNSHHKLIDKTECGRKVCELEDSILILM